MTTRPSRSTSAHASADAVTIRDVAALAGVSYSTVSRVVNDYPGVREETRRLVKEALGQLSYVPNLTARQLRLGSDAGIVGVIIEDVSNPFYSGIIRGAEDVLDKRGFLVIGASSEEDDERMLGLLRGLTRRRVDGLIVVPTGSGRPYDRLLAEPVAPTVFLDRPGWDSNADSLISDNFGAALGVVGHLIALGHSSIAMVGDSPAIWTFAERARGYRAAMANAGVPVDESLVALGLRDARSAHEATNRMLRRRNKPSAIFALNNRATAGVLQATIWRNEWPDVGAIDEFELGTLLPCVRAIALSEPRRLGRIAARLLLRRIAGKGDKPRHLVAPAVVRTKPAASSGRLQRRWYEVTLADQGSRKPLVRT